MLDIGGLPRDHVDVPEAVMRLAAGRTITPAWVNQVGGLTFRLDGQPDAPTATRTDPTVVAPADTSAGSSSAGSSSAGSVYVKWAPHGAGLDLRGEIARLAWAGEYTPVPTVLDHGHDDDARWMVTAAMPGTSAVDPRWHDDPRPAVVAAGRGLRALHDALPVADCPFEWSVPMRIARSGASRELVDALGPAPEPDRMVVCHGDPCTPNTILDDEGRWVGHVDLDMLGIADRWADLAVGTMALGWNFGPGWDDVYLDAYGIEPDAERTAWYRALWNLGSEPIPDLAESPALHRP